MQVRLERKLLSPSRGGTGPTSDVPGSLKIERADPKVPLYLVLWDEGEEN